MMGADRLVSALENEGVGGGGHLVSVPADYSENMRVPVDELRAHERDMAARH
jgi:acetolactate synthase I/II/III large subunit